MIGTPSNGIRALEKAEPALGAPSKSEPNNEAAVNSPGGPSERSLLTGSASEKVHPSHRVPSISVSLLKKWDAVARKVGSAIGVP